MDESGWGFISRKFQGEDEWWSLDFVSKHLGSEKLPKSDLMEFLQRNGTAEYLQTFGLSGEAKKMKKMVNCVQLIDAYKVYLIRYAFPVYLISNVLQRL